MITGSSGNGTWTSATTPTDWVTSAGTDTYWVNGSSGTFAGTDGAAAAAYTVTLGSSLSASTLTFNASGYNLSAASAQTLNLTGNGSVITVAAGKTLDIGNNTTVNFTTQSNTGDRIVLGTGAVLNIESGATYTRTALPVNLGLTNGSLGFAGAANGATATVNVSGTVSYNAAISSGGNYGGVIIANTSGDNFTVNVNSGGILSSNSAYSGVVVANGAGNTTGVLNVNAGGTVSTSGTSGFNAGINLTSSNATNSGTVNLNGGTISTYEITPYFNVTTAGTGSGTGKFNFNGGSLVAIANNTAFMTGLTAANVLANGANFNTSGFNITVGQNLLAGTTSTGGGLTKSGAGTLTLSGTGSTYAGPTVVSAGTLAVTGGLTGTSSVAVNGGLLNVTGTVAAASGVTVASGASLTGSGTGTIAGAVTVNAGGAIDFSKDGLSSITTLGLGGVTLAGSGGTAATLTYNIGSTGTDVINAGAFFNVSAGTPDVVNFNLLGTLGSGTNTYVLANYASTNLPIGTVPSSLLTTSNVPTGYQFTLSATATALDLTETPLPSPPVAYWTGKVDTVWSDTGSGGTATNFASNQAGTTDAGQAPSVLSDVVFTAGANGTGGSLTGAAINATLGSNFTINSLTVNATAASVTIGSLAAGKTLTLNAAASQTGGLGYAAGTGLVVAPGAGPVTINAATLIPANSQSWNNGSASPLVVNSAVNGNAIGTNVTTLTLANTGTGGTTLGGAIGDGSGGGTLAVVVSNSGAGTTTFSGTNTYSGGTTLNAGTLVAGSASPFGTGAVTLAPASGGTVATLDFNAAAPTVTALNGASGSVVLNSPTGTALTVGTTTGANANAATTFSGVISEGTAGMGSLIKAGSGTLTLNGSVPNTYTGTTNVSGGYTILADAGGNAVPGNLIVTGASTYLLLQDPEQIADTGTLTLNTNGHFILNGYTETVAGLTTTTPGSNDLAEASEGTPVTGSGQSTLVVNVTGSNSYTFDGIIRNDSTGGSGTFALTKNGSGTQTLTNTSGVVGMTFSGGVTINGGTLALVDNGNGLTIGTFASPVVDNATLSLSDTKASDSRTFSQAISTTGTGNLLIPATNLGTVALGVANSYNGTTTVNGGTLRANATTATGSSVVAVNNGGTLGGNGSVGAVVVNAGGTITAGASNVSTGTLTTGAATWNSSGGYTAKIQATTGTVGTVGVSDLLVMSGLAISSGTGSSSFSVTALGTGVTLTTGQQILIATDSNTSSPSATNPFQTAYLAGQLTLNTAATTVSAAAGGSLGLAYATDAGGYELYLTDVAVAAPEPASLLMLGLAAGPLALGRRRKARHAPLA